MSQLKRQPLTRTYNRFALLLRLYIDLASGIPIASQFGPKWLRVQISDFPALSARPRIGSSKPTEDNGMSAGEVKQYLVEHAKSHGVLSFRGNRARRVQTLLPALGSFSCQAVPGGGAEAAAWFIVPIEEHRRPAIRKANPVTSADRAGREAATGCGGAARVFLHGVLGCLSHQCLIASNSNRSPFGFSM
jgi:hypothetical protein